MGQPVEIAWSADALGDLDRFAAFLHEHHPDLAPVVARSIIAKAQVLSDFPRLGRPLEGREEYRQLVLQILNTPYVFQYRFADDRLVILRVFHGREQRD